MFFNSNGNICWHRSAARWVYTSFSYYKTRRMAVSCAPINMRRAGADPTSVHEMAITRQGEWPYPWHFCTYQIWGGDGRSWWWASCHARAWPPYRGVKRRGEQRRSGTETVPLLCQFRYKVKNDMDTGRLTVTGLIGPCRVMGGQCIACIFFSKWAHAMKTTVFPII